MPQHEGLLKGLVATWDLDSLEKTPAIDNQQHPTTMNEALQLLRDLADLQNGPPLEQHRKQWEETMEQVYAFLNKQ